MSAPTRGSERLVALFVAVLWAAVVFAIDGLLAVILNAEPIAAGVGPYYALIASALAGFAVWLVVSGTIRSRVPVWGAVAGAASVYFVFAIVAVPWGFPLVAQQLQSPFVIAAALLAAIAVVGTWAALRSLRWRR
ncbi:MAG TPA: hypothetical protein VNT53_00285 [Pseudolysinimonas sp.]|nr:hypothetical protein [Pseudolysinimonas sp.]